MNVGKTVKKLLQQKKSLSFIAEVINSHEDYTLTPTECLDEYYKYMGMVNPTVHTSENLVQMVKDKKKIHLFGATGSGKSYAIKQVANALDIQMIKSYARGEEELVADFSDLPYTEEDILFVLEGDNYYWRKYGIIRNYIRDSVAPFVVITTGKDTPTKNITKHLEQVKSFAPTKEEVADFLSIMEGEEISQYSEIVSRVYERDWHKILRKYKFGTQGETKTLADKEEINAKRVAYLVAKGEATEEDFENCEHPFSFIINWLGYNTPKFFYEDEKAVHNLDLVSFIDQHKYNMKEKYLRGMLMEYKPAQKKSYMKFPPFQKLKKEKKKEKKYTITKYKRKKSQEKTKSVKEELGDMLLI